nr:hypothetical protein [Nostoc sp. DedSLP05]
MSQNKITTICLSKRESVGRKQLASNPKANPDAVAEKKRLKHCQGERI